MLDILSNFGLDITFIAGGLLLSSIVLFVLYRKYFFSIFEPLSTFVVAQIGDATIMWCLPLISSFKWQFVAYMLSLWLGFALKSKVRGTVSPMMFNQHSLFDLKFTLVTICILVVAANLYLGASAGFPLLSANPTDAKFTVYTGGLGLVRRLNMGPYYLFCCGCVLLIVLNQSRRLAFVLLGSATSLVLLSGGKSVILPLLFSASFAIAHKGVCPSDEVRKKARKYLIIIFGMGLSLALVVTTKEQGGLTGGVQGLLLRLLLAGDGIAYYFPRREIVLGMVDASFSGYLHNILSDTMGMLRIGTYQDALGAVIQGSEEGGPNVQYFLMADIFFKPVTGCIYSFGVGYVIALFRNGFFHCRTRSIGRLTIQLFLALVAFDLAIEAGLFVTEVFTAFLFFAPIYFLVRLCRSALSDPMPWHKEVQTSRVALPLDASPSAWWHNQ